MATVAFRGAVLTGGASRRMGSDKARLELGGVAMASRVAAVLYEAGAMSVVAVGGDTAGLAGLGFDVVADRWPGEGPLGGIVTALGEPADRAEEAHAAVIVVAACDLPSLTAEVVTTLVDRLEGADADTALAAVPVVNGVRQNHLLALRRGSLGPLGEAFERGGRAVQEALAGIGVVEVVLDVDQAGTLDDVDTPADASAFGSLNQPHPEGR